MAELLVLILRCYKRFISPVLPPACRFYPSCSEYCIEVMRIHPLGKALLLSLRRILRCHPWGGCGFDPPPQREQYQKRVHRRGAENTETTMINNE